MNEGSTIGQPVTPWVKSGGRYSNSYSGSAFFIPFFPFSLFPFFPFSLFPFFPFSKSLIEVVGKRPCGPMPTYNGFPFYPFILLSFYPFIEKRIEAVGWRHYVPYPTYLKFKYLPVSWPHPAHSCRH